MEFLPFECKFGNCRHLEAMERVGVLWGLDDQEPDCKVKEAVEEREARKEEEFYGILIIF